MNFQTSTHRRKWVLDAEALAAKRAASYAASCERVKQMWVEEMEGKEPEEWRPLELEEDLLLQKFHQKNIQELCKNTLHLPPKVSASAIQLFKRFTLGTSLLEHDAVKLLLTCIYVACKVEESYINAEDLCTRVSLKAYKQGVLDNEVLLLQAVDFDMVIYNAFRPLDGLFAAVQEWAERGREGGAPEALLEGGASRLAEARAAAMSAVDALQLSDAPLLHPPGILALAAMKNGLRKVSKDESLFLAVLDHVLQQRREAVGGAADDAPAAAVMRDIAAVDQLGMAGAEKLSRENLKALDSKLQSSRSPLLNPKSRLSRAAKGAGRRGKAAKEAGASSSGGAAQGEQSTKRQCSGGEAMAT